MIAKCYRTFAMELRHLEYFVAVAAELNFSRAAQHIHVVQSALSAAVSRLEEEVGVELFDRSRRPVEAFPDQLTGTVTLGTLMSSGTLDLPGALEEFRRPASSR